MSQSPSGAPTATYQSQAVEPDGGLNPPRGQLTIVAEGTYLVLLLFVDIFFPFCLLSCNQRSYMKSTSTQVSQI